jgi:integrase
VVSLVQEGFSMAGRRHFGNVRKLPSGRYQASYWHEGLRQVADLTFATKGDALAHLSAVEVDLRRGAWINPRAGLVTLSDYSTTWIASRPALRPTTVARYRLLLDGHILPVLGRDHLADISPGMVRSWHALLARRYPSTAAGAYRLLSAMLRTAAADELIARSPCKVTGAGVEHAAERPVASIAEVEAAIAAAPERYRLGFLLAAWCQLRRGEILGLQRRDIDLLRGSLNVERTWVALATGTSVVGPPKTASGRRTVYIPPHVLPAAEEHLQRFVGAAATSWLFKGEGADPVGTTTFDRMWAKSRAAIGRSDLRLHDLRHSGLTWAAASGASVAELMRQAGHASPVAALRYQHATDDRAKTLAAALSGLATSAEVVSIGDGSAARSRT